MQTIKKFLFLLFLFLFCIEVSAEKLLLTKISNTNNKISIEFNNNLQLHDFTLTDNNLLSPFYENKENKYYFFYFLDRNFKNDIIKKIQSNDTDIVYKNKGKIEYKINKCSIPKQPKKILAFMSVIFNDNIEINCNILKGPYGLWIAWPSIKEQNKWKKLFNIKDKHLKENIEKKLIEHYKQKNNADKL